MNRSLMVTLGHNSSVVYFDGKNLIGYEEERLDKVKSSSSFPKKSLEKISSKFDIKGCKMFVSHWYDQFDLSKVNDDKHLDKKLLFDFVSDNDIELIPLSDEFTHHDAHAYSSLAFLLNNIDFDTVKNVVKGETVSFLVVDGFGNKQEVVSLYECDVKDLFKKNCELKLIERFSGYKNSLGLMYQYATTYCGMKCNQDEYKFLGYESHIEDILDDKALKVLDDKTELFVKTRVSELFSKDENFLCSEDYINTEELSIVSLYWNNVFDDVLSWLSMSNNKDFNVRVVIGYFIQKVIEDVLASLINRYDIKNVCLSGGVFYNVKLNNNILKRIDGMLSVVPLAGDQGAAIGMYQKEFGQFCFKDLCIGDREEFDINVLNNVSKDVLDRIFVYKDRKSVVSKVVDLLKRDSIVNFVEGRMEFGPRALCHTSTIAMPYSENVDCINTLNKRNTVMPMAPVMLEDSLVYFFDKCLYNRVVGSDKFMIVTYDYNENIDKDFYRGVMHKYPRNNAFSGRPQVIEVGENKVIKFVLLEMFDYTKCLINTSYNVHGNPILYDYSSIVEDFVFQCGVADKTGDKKPYLVMYV